MAHKMEEKLHVQRVDLRKAEHRHRKILWEWANDATTRSMALKNDTIIWEEHCRWFEYYRQRTDSCIFVAYDLKTENAIGQIRLDTDQKNATIDISVAPGFRGKGWGITILNQLIAIAILDFDFEALIAYVKPENRASFSLFLKAGFIELPNPNSSDSLLYFKKIIHHKKK